MINQNLNKCLENEFSKFGFDYSEIEANGVKIIDDKKSEMYLVDYTGMPEMLADGIAILFTINIDGEQRQIEEMAATLFNNSSYGKLTPLIERCYSIEYPSRLPNKAQIYQELTNLYKARVMISRNVNAEFTRLGFDVSTISGLTNISMPNLQKGEIVLTDLYSDKDSLGYLFDLRKGINTAEWHLHAINASVQLDTVRTREGVIVIGKKYSCSNAPLPTKSQISREVLEMVRVEKIKEKFALDKNNRTNCKRRNL